MGMVSRFIPVHLSKEEVRRIYARMAPFYDLWGALTESKAAGTALRLADIRDGEAVLEVAVGTGRAFARIVALNPNGRNEGIDLSPEMLARAGKRLRGKDANYDLSVADAFKLPFEDGTFDLIMNSYMFDLLPEEDFGRVLAEFRRVLKRGGRTVITSMAPGRRWYSRIWDRLISRRPGLLAGCRPVSLEADMAESGFTDIRTIYVSQFTFPSSVTYGRKR
jgi:ubiquinone/menaquinone biosynthesis C-methylase UbiE